MMNVDVASWERTIRKSRHHFNVPTQLQQEAQFLCAFTHLISTSLLLDGASQLPSEHVRLYAMNPPQPGPGGPPPGMPQPGQQPTPEQIQMMQRQLAAEAEKRGLTVQQYIEELKQQAMQQHQMRMQQQGMQQQGGPPQQQQQGGQGQPQPIQPGPPNPAAIAVANFLKSQELKPRTVIHDEKRKEMFRGAQREIC
jgi:hypothetical protein